MVLRYFRGRRAGVGARTQVDGSDFRGGAERRLMSDAVAPKVRKIAEMASRELRMFQFAPKQGYASRAAG